MNLPGKVAQLLDQWKVRPSKAIRMGFVSAFGWTSQTHWPASRQWHPAQSTACGFGVEGGELAGAGADAAAARPAEELRPLLLLGHRGLFICRYEHAGVFHVGGPRFAPRPLHNLGYLA